MVILRVSFMTQVSRPLRMLHIPANFLSKTTFQLLSKPLLLPWVNVSSRIAYAKGRDLSSSSLPVRYVPNKLSVRKMTFEDHNLKMHRDLEPEVEGAKLYNPPERSLILDEQEAVSSFDPCVGSGEEEITIGLLAADNYIDEPDELAAEHQCNLMDPLNGKDQTQPSGSRPDAEKLAIRLLSRRAYTASELRKKLQGKNFSLDIVDAVVADFENRGYINDCLYAESFSRSRFTSSCWGPKRIKQALFKKGISKSDSEDAVKLVFEEDESVEDPELVAGISKLSMDHLLVQVSKQWLRNQKVSSEKRKSRLIQWLQYRGYSWNVISFVLKKLESGYVP